jgi:hypothetical protein
MPNRGGFSWKRLSGISAAKARVSRSTGIPFTRSGRQRKIGRAVSGGGCLLPLVLLVILLGALACGSAGTSTPPAKATALDGKALAATLAVITPDATNEPALSDDERAYIEKVLDIIGPIQKGMQTVGELSLAAGDNNSLILDNDWRTTMGLQLGIIKGSAQMIQDLKAPAKFAGVQAELVTMATRMDEGATLYAQGLDEVDPKKITQASAKFEEGTAAMKRVSQLVVDLQQGKASASSPASAPSVASGPTAAKGANLRSGPGTTFAVVGGAKAGDPLAIVGKNAAGDWYKLAGGQWIAAFLVTSAPADVPVVDAPSSSAPAPTSMPAASRSGVVAVPLAKEPPTAGASSCPCDKNTLNCDDFPTDGWDAQACFMRCKELTERDVHDLDRDSDGAACEWNW